MHKDTIQQKLHIGWRIYFGVTVTLQLLAIISFVSIRIIVANVAPSESRALVNDLDEVLVAAALILILFGVVNSIAATAVYLSHVLTESWRRILLGVIALSAGTLLTILGVIANFFLERSAAIQQIESNNNSGKIIPLSQPKSQE
ncbi:MAG: hypothetical protein EOO68_36430 [Moraxellaceae bacterium]|nr:MAG: hypothetical protein EOO68_36430 [Moraxellaceae bacterium]